MSSDSTLTPYEQYGMFIGFLKAVESVAPIFQGVNDDKLVGMILSSLNTRCVEACFPNGGFDQEKLYKIQEDMHKLEIPDRMTSFMEEIYDRMPKESSNMSKSQTHERIMDAMFPRKQDNQEDMK